MNENKDKYIIQSKLGSGKFGKVYRVQNKENGGVYAMKCVNTEKASDIEIKNEISIQTGLHHPNIIELIESITNSKRCYLILEYAPIELFNLLTDRGRFTIERSCSYVLSICSAMRYLHEHQIIHRDIKPENLLLSLDGTIKLTDFGLAKKTNIDLRAKTWCGTDEYLAPEVILQITYDNRVDIWGIGILFYEFLTGVTPFVNESTRKIHKNILKGVFDYPGYLLPEVKLIISGILQIKPKNRLNISQIESNEWMISTASQFLKGNEMNEFETVTE